jgi:hypothetical protein
MNIEPVLQSIEHKLDTFLKVQSPIAIVQSDRIEKIVIEILEKLKDERTPLADKWLTESQVLKILNVGKKSLQRIRLSNKIRFSSATGRKFLYYKADVENYIYDNSSVIRRKSKSG